jgi:hypothetical protein
MNHGIFEMTTKATVATRKNASSLL